MRRESNATTRKCNENRMRIMHVANSIARPRGGLSCAVWETAAAQRIAGHTVSLAAMADPDYAPDRPVDRAPDIFVHTFPPSGPRAALWSFGLHAALMNPAIGGQADIIHQHGLWSACSHSVGRWSARWKRPALLAIRGSLSESTLKRHPWRKRIFGLLGGNKRLRTASCLHALCEPEVRNIRNFGSTVPVVVVPNGVRLEDYSHLPDPSRFAESFPQCSSRRMLLYLGRIHPLKGVAPLLDAWKRVETHRRNGWLLVVAGPNDFGFEDKMKKKVQSLELSRDVLFTGPLYEQAKLEALAAASLFVLPSFSEGFPNSLLEAMACRLPLVQTHQCNFDQVESEGAGWVGEPNEDSLAELMADALSKSNAELRAIGRHGYDLVRRKYTWDRICRELELVYQWMLGQGPVPPSLRAA